MREIILPWPSAHLSPNSRKHWTVRKKETKAARQLAWGIAKEAGWTGDGLPAEGRLHLWVDFYPPTRIGIDDDNALSRFKAYRDGIADALGINDKRFVSHPYVHDEVRKGGEVRVRITDGSLT